MHKCNLQVECSVRSLYFRWTRSHFRGEPHSTDATPRWRQLDSSIRGDLCPAVIDCQLAFMRPPERHFGGLPWDFPFPIFPFHISHLPGLGDERYVLLRKLFAGHNFWEATLPAKEQWTNILIEMVRVNKLGTGLLSNFYGVRGMWCLCLRIIWWTVFFYIIRLLQSREGKETKFPYLPQFKSPTFL